MHSASSNKPFAYDKLNINNIIYDNKTKNLYYKDKNLSLLILRGGSMILDDLIFDSNNTNQYINLLFNDNQFCIFTYDLDSLFIKRLQSNYKNIENEYIHSTRTSIYKNTNDIFLRCRVSPIVEYFNQKKELISYEDVKIIVDKLKENNDTITCVPLFKLTLKNLNNFKYIDYELIQLKINTDETYYTDDTIEQPILTECVITDEDEIEQNNLII